MALDSTQATTSALAGLDAPTPTAPAYVGPAAQPAPTFFGRLLQGALNGLAGGIQSGEQNIAGAGTPGFTPRANGLAYAQQLQARQDQAKQQQQTDATQAAQQDFENRTKQYQAEQEATVQKAQAVQAKLGAYHLAQQIQNADQDHQDAYFKGQAEDIKNAQDNGGQVVATIPHVPLDGKTPQERGAAYIQQHPDLMADPHSQIKFTADGDGEISIHVLKYDPDARASADEINRQLASVGSERKVPAGSTMSAADAHSLVSQEAGLAANAHAESKKEEFRSALALRNSLTEEGARSADAMKLEDHKAKLAAAAGAGSNDAAKSLGEAIVHQGLTTDVIPGFSKAKPAVLSYLANNYPNLDQSSVHLTGDEIKRKALAQNATHNIQTMAKALDGADDLVGPVNGRLSALKVKTGTNDPRLGTIDAAADAYAIATVGAHGSRSKQVKDDAKESLLNGLKNGPAALKAAQDEMLNSLKDFTDAGKPKPLDPTKDLKGNPLPATESKTPSGADAVPTAGPNEIVKRRPKPGGGYEYKVVPKP